ncbi:hypothetical protein BJV74DRAFT_401932 [Russula compacta]|nr:hypothetical protein BJV74DRAFT_401932 [Russula compacta]
MLVDGPHFQATDEGKLVFLVSDGDSSRRPTEHDILEPEEEDGTLRQNYYLRVPLDDPDSHRWRAEIAKYLAPLVLSTRMGRLPWTLADFPQGYILLLHKSPRRARPSSNLPRRDFYLYGATDVPSFASPLEFVRHAEWLMRGAHRTLDTRRSPRCTCKYCDASTTTTTTTTTRKSTRGGPSSSSSGSGSSYKKQSVISRELRRVRNNVLARINRDGGEEDEDEDEEVADAIAEEVDDAEAEAEADADADADDDDDDVKPAGAGTDAGVGTDADADADVDVDVDAIATTTAAPATINHDSNAMKD